MKEKHIILHSTTPVAEIVANKMSKGSSGLRDFVAETKKFGNSEARFFDAETDAFKASTLNEASSDFLLQTTIAELSAEEAEELKQNDPAVYEVAPAMPLQLIQPVSNGAAVNLAAAGPASWGIDAVGALTSPYTGKGIKIAILDTGIDRTHPAFTGINISAENFTTDANSDLHGHGTHCAATAFGRDVNGQRVGVATGVTDVLIGKVLGNGGGDTAIIQKAMEWAIDNGAHVISMSLGIDFPGYVESQKLLYPGRSIREITSIALTAYRKTISVFNMFAASTRASRDLNGTGPVLFIAAAGNESDRPTFSVSTSLPAVSEGFFSVGALEQSGAAHRVAKFSNSEPMLSAPGVNITSAKVGGGLTMMSGTSMATPHVTGVAALWAEKLKKDGLFNYNMLSAKLLASCSSNSLATERTFYYGAGIVQAPQ